LVKDLFHRLVKVTLLLRLLSANCQPGCPPPIHHSSLLWLVVMLPLVMPHPPPPVVFTMRRLILSSSCCATSTSYSFKVPPAFKTPSPLVRWCLWLIVTTPLVAPLPLLVLLMIHRLLSVNASPPIGLLFASWLLSHPCCCAAATSPPLNTLPLPLILSTCRLQLKMSHLRLVTCCRLLSAGASPLVCLSFAGRFSHIILSRHCLKCPSLTPPSFTPAGCWSHLVALLPPTVLSSILPPLDAQATHLSFASRLPQLVACVFDLVCPISRFMAICQGYAPTYLYTTGVGGGGVYPICICP
jgi:hypothetical protein